jgi:hypothetical protein
MKREMSLIWKGEEKQVGGGLRSTQTGKEES